MTTGGSLDSDEIEPESEACSVGELASWKVSG